MNFFSQKRFKVVVWMNFKKKNYRKNIITSNKSFLAFDIVWPAFEKFT